MIVLLMIAVVVCVCNKPNLGLEGLSRGCLMQLGRRVIAGALKCGTSPQQQGRE